MSQPFNQNGAHSNGSGAGGSGANGASPNGGAPHDHGFETRGALGSSGGRALERFAPAPVAAYPSAPMGGDDEDDTVDLGRYWRALKRRWPLALKTFLTVLALGVVWTALQKPVYQSSPATILVSDGSGSAGGGAGQFTGLFGGGATSRSLGQQMIIIRSPGVQSSALSLLKPDEKQQIEEFSRPDIAPEPGAEAIDVQVQARTPEAAAAFANAICHAYLEQSKEQATAQVNDRTRDVSAKLVLAQRDLNRASDRIRHFNEQHQIGNLETEGPAIAAQVAQAQADVRANDTQLASDERSLQVVNEQIKSLPPLISQSIVPTASAEELQKRIIALGIERTDKRRQYTEESRTIRDIDTQIANLRAQLKVTQQTQPGALVPNPVRQTALQKQSDLITQIQASKTRAVELRRAVALAQAAKAQLPGRTYSLGQLQDQEAMARQLVKTLADQYQTLRVQEIGRVTTARVINPALPGPMIAPRRTFNIVASALLGLILGAMLALLADRLDDRVHAGEDAEDAAHLPILAHVPLVERGGAALLVSNGGGATQNPALVESFRMLRANIAFAGLDEPPRVVAITSSRAGEGKSTCALNLATVMALSGKSVLLVDCDLRRPGVHAMLGASNEIGLSSVAAGMASLESAVQNTPVAGLRVLTSGPIPPNAPELLDSRGGREALRAASEMAEFVVLDCPPALGLADAHLVAALADATLLVVECEVTTKRDLARVTRSLNGAGARLLGIVFNKTPVTRGENEGYFQLPTLNGASGLLVSSPSHAGVRPNNGVVPGGVTTEESGRRG